MGKSVLRAFFLFFFLAEILIAAQFSVGLGRVDFANYHRYPLAGNNFSLAWTPMEHSRLQLGLKYSSLSVKLSNSETERYGAGFLTSKLLLRPAARSSCFFGFNLGAQVLGEAVAGLRVRLNNNSALEFSWLQRYQEVKDHQFLHSNILMFNYTWFFYRASLAPKTAKPEKKQFSKEGNVKVRREYLQKKLSENHLQISRYDLLLKKYSLNELPGEQTMAQEKELIEQARAKLLQENSEIKELLAL